MTSGAAGHRPTIVAVVAARPDGSTAKAAADVMDGAALEGAACRSIVLGQALDEALVEAQVAALRDADGVILATPTYRATYAAVLKQFLDRVERAGPAGAFESVLRGTPVAIVATGASDHHFLGVDPLVALLVRFFGAWVVPPCLYRSPTTGTADDAAERLGRSLCAMARAGRADPCLRGILPQA